jgi:1-acyl-sn-glycerol-3-phosphate acyltransferase
MARRVFDVLLIDRAPVPGNPDSMGLMLEALDCGTSLILFPEGSRGSAEEPMRFRSGLYNLALKRPDVELVPVRLENLGRVLPKGELIPLPLPTTVTFRQPICVQPGEDREAFLVRARAAVMPESAA